jgi:MYXO-CTERM domain-containing protein
MALLVLPAMARPAQASAISRYKHRYTQQNPEMLAAETAWLHYYEATIAARKAAPHHRTGSLQGQTVVGTQALSLHNQAGETTSATINLAGHQVKWSLNVKIPSGIHLHLTNGLLPDTPLVEYLRWRRSLDPARFDHYHPNVGPMLAEDALTRMSLLNPPPNLGQVVNPPGTPPPPVPVPPLPPNPPDAKVSEPSSALLGLVLAGAAGWLRRRAHSRA